jgi:hypothetical protein
LRPGAGAIQAIAENHLMVQFRETQAVKWSGYLSSDGKAMFQANQPDSPAERPRETDEKDRIE